MNACARLSVPDYPCDIVNPGQRQGILFLHGFLGSREEFKRIGRQFERTHTVLYADLPGHGAHNLIETSWHGNAFHLASLMRSSPPLEKGVGGFSNWHIVGYSLGGRIALYLACRWPELVSRLTLISASPGLVCARERRARLLADRALSKQIARGSMRSFLNDWYRQPLFENLRSHPCFSNVFAQRMRNEPSQIAEALVAMSVGAQPPLWEELAALQVPTQLVCGERDAKFVQIAREMAGRNPSIQLTAVAQAGHAVHCEKAKAVKAILAGL